jgi:hypothetical protein
MLAHTFWIIYLGILGTSAIGLLLKGKYKTIRTKLDFVISIITWIGLFGFVADKQILTPMTWKIVFIVGLLWDVLFTTIFYDYEEELPFVARIFGLTLLIPLYYGIYQYAF